MSTSTKHLLFVITIISIYIILKWYVIHTGNPNDDALPDILLNLLDS